MPMAHANKLKRGWWKKEERDWGHKNNQCGKLSDWFNLACFHQIIMYCASGGGVTFAQQHLLNTQKRLESLLRLSHWNDDVQNGACNSRSRVIWCYECLVIGCFSLPTGHYHCHMTKFLCKKQHLFTFTLRMNEGSDRPHWIIRQRF